MLPAPVALPDRFDAALKHLWLHLAVGTALSVALLAGVAFADLPSEAGFQEMPLIVLACLMGALLVGGLRLPALLWLGRQAGQHRWPVGRLLLASAGLFLAPILGLFLLGEAGRYVGMVSLVASAPYLMGYVAATYWLRRPLCQPQPGAA